MPVLDGIEATRRLAGHGLASSVLVLTTFDLDDYVYEALRAGAGGFLLKDASPARLADDGRTVREQEVLVLIARGLSNGEIAARLHLSEATVKTHVGRVLGKLGVRDRVGAVVLAYESGLVEPGEAGEPETSLS
jgi:DNA-binding NarL/FixJ family response regulator